MHLGPPRSACRSGILQRIVTTILQNPGCSFSEAEANSGRRIDVVASEVAVRQSAVVWREHNNLFYIPVTEAQGSIQLRISFRQPRADQLQFALALCIRFGKTHFESFERIENNSRHDQPSILFVVGGNDIPGGVIGCLSR